MRLAEFSCVTGQPIVLDMDRVQGVTVDEEGGAILFLDHTNEPYYVEESFEEVIKEWHKDFWLEMQVGMEQQSIHEIACVGIDNLTEAMERFGKNEDIEL